MKFDITKPDVALNGKVFASHPDKLVDALFDGSKDSTIYAGLYKITKNAIHFFMLDGVTVIAVINKKGVLGSARKVDGKVIYSYCTPEIIGEYDSYMASVNEPERAYKDVFGIHPYWANRY